MSDEQLLTFIYNLILDPSLTEAARKLLVDFKNRLQPKSDLEDELRNLADDMRRLAVKNLGHTSFSPKMQTIYKLISQSGLLKENLARGLAAVGPML